MLKTSIKIRDYFHKLSRGFRNHEFQVLLSLTIFILSLGTFVYHRVENWRWLDSLYFSVTTLTTVGLGDFAPKTDFGKTFTIFYIFVGIGVILSFINAVGHANQAMHPRNNVKNSKA
ncbi:MAG: potassium channel family protein [Candidatus Falkowbacteria bacterium]|nr:potassium channel family protein [Candidatus Falkowbacteria bacterium]